MQKIILSSANLWTTIKALGLKCDSEMLRLTVANDVATLSCINDIGGYPDGLSTVTLPVYCETEVDIMLSTAELLTVLRILPDQPIVLVLKEGAEPIIHAALRGNAPDTWIYQDFPLEFNQLLYALPLPVYVLGRYGQPCRTLFLFVNEAPNAFTCICIRGENEKGEEVSIPYNEATAVPAEKFGRLPVTNR